MAYSIRPYSPADREAIHTLARHSSLAAEFSWLLDNGELEDPAHHPFGAVLGPWIGASAEGLVGFSMLLQFDSEREPWTLLRVGVLEPYRRLGWGRALARHALHALTPSFIRPGERLRIGYWHPSPVSESFARALGFRPDRFFWTLERPGRGTLAVDWPDGLEHRTFDGSDRALQDWAAADNAAFAENAMSPTSTVERCRILTTASHFDPSGLILVYRDGRCVGFCRCAIHPDHGDVDVLGVTPDARGIGLGRALLRWGVTWLLEHQAPAVRLMVDGENEAALRLYRSEGFGPVRTRAVWKRAPSD